MDKSGSEQDRLTHVGTTSLIHCSSKSNDLQGFAFKGLTVMWIGSIYLTISGFYLAVS